MPRSPRPALAGTASSRTHAAAQAALLLAEAPATPWSREPDTETGELSLHPSVAPHRVLPSQADDQLANAAVKRWSARTLAPRGPPPGEGVAVPPSHRLW